MEQIAYSNDHNAQPPSCTISHPKISKFVSSTESVISFRSNDINCCLIRDAPPQLVVCQDQHFILVRKFKLLNVRVGNESWGIFDITDGARCLETGETEGYFAVASQTSTVASYSSKFTCFTRSMLFA